MYISTYSGNWIQWHQILKLNQKNYQISITTLAIPMMKKIRQKTSKSLILSKYKLS